AVPGESLIAFGTGFGKLTSAVTEGSISPDPPVATIGTPSVQANGKDCQLKFSGLAPGFVGVNQLTFVLPVGLGGLTHVWVDFSGSYSNTPGLWLSTDGILSTSPTRAAGGTTASIPVT